MKANILMKFVNMKNSDYTVYIHSFTSLAMFQSEKEHTETTMETS